MFADVKQKLIQNQTNMTTSQLSLERRQELNDAIIAQIKADMKHGDTTVLDELLNFIPEENLVQALPEEKWSEFPEVTIILSKYHNRMNTQKLVEQELHRIANEIKVILKNDFDADKSQLIRAAVYQNQLNKDEEIQLNILLAR